ncbi:helix-turn-helix domain-containing protein [Corynebacterium timonense]|uniref:DNA-binding transcriptional regulator, XRE family n=1 Tax=Corynebacterium timonense TaxID=441500 RepID=A0A1H1N7B5_9CORY|nr:helix-turn-helix transcriptional regulator [Corynebacterium timonense]SDR94770.1 DNA-binding transcriptional regulator, XRE family [Corynebacterium timonense]
MATTTLLLDTPTQQLAQSAAPERAPLRESSPQREPLLREALGMSLRAYRADKGISLRQLAAEAMVSSGYLSELERGRKEVSSELLQSICAALGASVADVVFDAASNLSLQSLNDELEHAAPAAAEA